MSNPPDHSSNDPSLDRDFFLPRLPPAYYQGDAVVHWTLPIACRTTGWLTEKFHSHFREIMLHAAARETLFCPTYCLMPDHMHFMWMGLRQKTHQLNAMKFFRRRVAVGLGQHHFQHQAYDHVLRDHERRRGSFAKTCFYIIDNARKEGLVSDPTVWPFAGAIVPGYPSLHPLQPNFWELFWRLYSSARDSDAGNIRRPPFGKI